MRRQKDKRKGRKGEGEDNYKLIFISKCILKGYAVPSMSEGLSNYMFNIAKHNNLYSKI